MECSSSMLLMNDDMPVHVIVCGCATGLNTIEKWGSRGAGPARVRIQMFRNSGGKCDETEERNCDNDGAAGVCRAVSGSGGGAI
jgi:hypothetical protein